MKSVGYACGVVAVVSATAFSVQARSELQPDRGPGARVAMEASASPTGVPPETPPTRHELVALRASVVAALERDDPPAMVRLAAPDTIEEEVVEPRERSRNRWRRSRDRWAYRYEPLPPPERWQPPEGPVRIALQAGHWRADEAPDELSGLRNNGTRGGGLYEWEANLAIAREAARQLEQAGYEVDILPAVVPPGYRAHLFIAIHADGANDPAARGYRVAAPRRDPTGRADGLVRLLEERYGEVTGLRRLPTVTRRMQNYYAFNYGRYEHSLHPLTISVIIETGFLTSPRDREVIVDAPERAARGIVEAVMAFPETPAPAVAASTERRNGSR